MAQLKYGIEHGGKIHKNFTPKLLTLGGELAALEYTGSLGDDIPEARRNVLSALAFVTQQVMFDGIDSTDLTPELLSELDVEDYELLSTALEDYRKKRHAVGDSSPA